MKYNTLSQLIKMMILGSSWLSVSTSIDASDLQIYAGPGTGGQKTLIMMLDRSGSMGMLADDDSNNAIVADYDEFRMMVNGQSVGNYQLCSYSDANGRTKYKQETIVDTKDSTISYTKNYCVGPVSGLKRYDRLSRLKSGMFEMLNSADPKLEKVYIGLGYYSNNDSVSGIIKVPAQALGPVNSAHRKLLKQEIAKITAGYSTPTSHAYAEAAAYLLGTNTTNISYLRYNLIERRSYDAGTTVAYRLCENAFFNKCVGTWTDWVYAEPDVRDYTYSYSDVLQVGWTSRFYYRSTMSTAYMAGSGFEGSASSTKNAYNYNSPLPLTNATCDGQGIYILSDGQPNYTSDIQSELIARRALNDNDFSCDVANNLSNNVAGTDNGTGWKCMGAFAKRLYSGNNPKNRSIQTAFVGFGKEFSGNISSGLSKDTLNACQLGSTEAGDACSYYENDKLTPKPATTFRNSVDGFGKGGFFQVNTEADVTNSVLSAINNIEIGEITPLSTGSWSVPVDDLNPLGVLPYGYVRVIKPNPGTTDLLWAGNLKKYDVAGGTLTTAVANGTKIFNANGEFNPLTKDKWSNTSNDGGDVFRGGAYSKVPMPTVAAPNKARKLYTNFSLDSSNNLTDTMSKDSSLLKIPTPSESSVLNLSYILGQFNTHATLSKFSNNIKRKLLNYIGYNIDINDAALPSAESVALQADSNPWNSFGGISHSLPIQITYSGSLNADGELQSTRNQSVLFGTMEGGLRLVNADSGEEQFVFLPSDILNDPWQSLALRKTSYHDKGVSHGTDAPWVADTTYDYEETKDSNDQTFTRVKATQVNIYGGLRMGGSSYYALDITNPNSPKFKFRINPAQTAYSAMGQSWSKPVLANIRIDGKMKRVMIVGGGYDMCYEDPEFKLNTNYNLNPSKTQDYKTNCSNKTKAKGNAVYIIDAETGSRLFWVSNSGANLNQSDMVHSIVSDISTVDTDADGLIDHLYFGDLGGQLFRVDLNNLNKGSQAFGVRAVRIANLATNALGISMISGDAPRFYEAPTITMHRESNKRFLLISIASGDRSSPLDVAPVLINRPSNLPPALVGRPVNNVYGIIDSDALKADINTNYSASLVLQNITLKELLKDPQVHAKTLGMDSLRSKLYPYASTITSLTNFGWYRSLSSNADGVERSATGVFRKPGGIKAFEAPIAIKNTLVVSTYDPESQSLGEQDPCQVRVIGESFRQYYCLPFGVCLNADGTIDSDAEKNTGWRPARTIDKLPSEILTEPLGKGILGNALVGKDSTLGNCGALELGGNTVGTGEWACIAQTKPMNWYSK